MRAVKDEGCRYGQILACIRSIDGQMPSDYQSYAFLTNADADSSNIRVQAISVESSSARQLQAFYFCTAAPQRVVVEAFVQPCSDTQASTTSVTAVLQRVVKF